MFDKARTAIAGKKTYLLAAGAIIGSLVAWSEGMMNTLQLAYAIFGALMGCTIKAGVTREIREDSKW
jgi:hypothetical protein